MMGLVLQEYAGRDTGVLRVFRDWESACAHLCDHVLTWPEAWGWTLLLPTYGGRLSVTDGNKRYRLAKEVWKTEGDAGQWLYDEYAQAAKEALQTAECMGWVWTEAEPPCDRKAFGLSGILVVFSGGAVRTALLPGLGSAARVMEAKAAESSIGDRLQNPLPRESHVDNTPPTTVFDTCRRGMRRPRDRAKREARERLERLASEDPETKRFRLFRKCAQFVRSEMFNTYVKRGEPSSPPEDLRKAIREFGEWAAFKRSAGEEGP